MFVEVFIYLVIAFGVLTLSITLFEKDNFIKNRYFLTKNNDSFVKIKVQIEGLDRRDAKHIESILQRGEYNDIYDIANEFEVICS